MISALRRDEQEELADHIKSDKHHEGPHRRRCTQQSYWCVVNIRCRVRKKLFRIRKSPCMWRILNKKRTGGAGCHCELFISGASGTCLPAAQLHVMAAFHFVFSMSRTSHREWDMSFVAEIIFHFEIVIYPHAPVVRRQGTEWVKKKKGGAFSKLVTCKDL